VAFIARAPVVLSDVAVFGVASALGQNFVFLTLAYFGALALAAVTTTRKFFSILISVALFGHNLSTNQWLGVAAVFAGLGMEIRHKYAQTRARRAAAHVHSQDTTPAESSRGVAVGGSSSRHSSSSSGHSRASQR
jgi:UDP-galactose transporter B1